MHMNQHGEVISHMVNTPAKIGAVIGTCIGGPIGGTIGGVLGFALGVGLAYEALNAEHEMSHHHLHRLRH